MRSGKVSVLRSLSVVGIAVGLSQAAMGAASVSINPVTPISSTNVSLTSLGTSDWIRWEGNTSTLSAAPSQFDHFVAGGSKISTWAALPGSGNEFLDNNAADNSNVGFSWTNGTPNLTGSNTFGYIWGDANGNNSTNTGFSFTVATDASSYDLRLYGANYITTAKLVATVLSPSQAPLATATDTSWVNSNNVTPVIQSGYYDIIFNGAEAGDTLSVTFSVGTNFGSPQGTGEGYVGISAAALSTVPEPGMLGLALAGLLPIVARRRR